MPSDIVWVWIDKWYRSHKLLLHKTSLNARAGDFI